MASKGSGSLRVSLILALVRGLTGRGKGKAAAIAVIIALSTTASAAGERWKLPGSEVLHLADQARALALMEAEIARCEAASGTPDRCFDLVARARDIAEYLSDSDALLRLTRKQVAIADVSFKAAHWERVRAHQRLADLLWARRDYAGAVAHAEIIARAYTGIDDPAAIRIRRLFANKLESVGRYGDAEVLRRRVIDAQTAADRLPDPGDLTNLALNLSAQGQRDIACDMLAGVKVRYEAELPAGHPFIIVTLNNLALCQMMRGHDADAIALFEQALALAEARTGTTDPSLAPLLNNLAILKGRAGRLDDAERDARRLFEIVSAQQPRNPSESAVALVTLADILRARAKLVEAQATGRIARAMAVANLTEDSPITVMTTLSLATTLMESRTNPVEARALFRQASGNALARTRLRIDFGSAARADLVRWRAAFTGEVAAAWALGTPASRFGTDRQTRSSGD